MDAVVVGEGHHVPEGGDGLAQVEVAGGVAADGDHRLAGDDGDLDAGGIDDGDPQGPRADSARLRCLALPRPQRAGHGGGDVSGGAEANLSVDGAGGLGPEAGVVHGGLLVLPQNARGGPRPMSRHSAMAWLGLPSVLKQRWRRPSEVKGIATEAA